MDIPDAGSVGRIHELVKHLEKHHTAFAVSRLIMLSGVQVRRYTPQSPDDAASVRRIEAALPALLPAGDASAAIAVLHLETPRTEGESIMANIEAAMATSVLADTQAAVAEAIAAAKAKLGAGPISAVVLASTVDHPAAEVLQSVHAALPGTPVHGVTTSLGVLGTFGVAAGKSVGVLLLRAGAGASVCAASVALESDAHAAGAAVARRLADRAAGAAPRALFLGASPGQEEDIIQGVESVFPGVPIFGGSAADNAIVGEWSVFTEDGPKTSGVALLGFFGDLRAGGALVVPHVPTAKHAEITASDDRMLRSLGGRPAADVLGEWVGAPIAFQVAEGGNILAQTSLHPLGIAVSGANGPHYVTIHPAQIHRPDGNVSLFARAPVGATVCLMDATEDALIDALSRLVERALAASGLAPSEVRAGLLIYCAGCAGTVGHLLDAGLKKHLGGALGDAPIIGFCSFGEQGNVPGLGNVHQDLALSLLLVG